MNRIVRYLALMLSAGMLAGLCFAAVFAASPGAISENYVVVSQHSSSTLYVMWTTAPDTWYALYISESDNIASLDDCRANGILIEADEGLGGYTVVGLTADTTYFFNAVGTDLLGVSSAGVMTSGTTTSLPGSSTVSDLGLRSPDHAWAGGPEGLNFYAADNIIPSFFGIGVDYRQVALDRDYVKGTYKMNSGIGEPGGAIVTLTPEFLATLEDGEHVLALSFADIQGCVTFVVDRTGTYRLNPDTGAAEPCAETTLTCPFC